MKKSKKDFISLLDYSSKELKELIDIADVIKKNPVEYQDSLKNKTLGMIFAKNSTRTRISFQTGIVQLGGTGFYFGSNDLQLSRGETIHDTAKVLSRYLDGIMIRTFSYEEVKELARHAEIPVINGLTDYNHPCQVMADVMTIKEKFGKTKGLKMAYVGDGNNMALSLMFMCIKFGINISIVTPKDYSLTKEEKKQAEDLLAFKRQRQEINEATTKEDFIHLKHAEKLVKTPVNVTDEDFLEEAVFEQPERKMTAEDVEIQFTDNVEEGVAGSDIVYTDTWTSMGKEEERIKRLKDLNSYRVDKKVMSMAKKEAIFMHCLPAHRGEEVTNEVIDSPQSVVFDEAENRLHAQKAIMYKLMKG